MLLIAFFDQRPAPVENSLRVFAVYRACDIGLLLGVFALHKWAGNASFAEGMPRLAGMQPTVACLFLLLGAAGKAAQIPFSGWLPRAMEGPTPSSAIFYGAISIHAGAYLLLRAQPLLAEARAASVCVIVIGVATAIYGTMAGRASADAKTSLAFASLTQVGVIFVEIGLRWSQSRGPCSGARSGQDSAVPARAVDASRLSPHAFCHRRRGFTRASSGDLLTGTCSALALPVGARPRTPRHSSRSLVHLSPSATLEAVCPAGRNRNDSRAKRRGNPAISMRSPAEQGVK